MDTNTARRSPALLVVACNLVPLVGVLFFGWKILAVMLAFWLDNVAIGLFATGRILLARLDAATESGRSVAVTRVYAAWNFAFTYTIVCLVHGVLVVGLFGLVAEKLAGRPVPKPDDYVLALLRQPETLVAALGVLLTRGLEFFSGYVWPRAYEQADIDKEGKESYRRAGLLHMVVLLGGGIALVLHAPVAALVTLVVLKTGGELMQARR